MCYFSRWVARMSPSAKPTHPTLGHSTSAASVTPQPRPAQAPQSSRHNRPTRATLGLNATAQRAIPANFAEQSEHSAQHHIASHPAARSVTFVYPKPPPSSSFVDARQTPLLSHTFTPKHAQPTNNSGAGAWTETLHQAPACSVL